MQFTKIALALGLVASAVTSPVAIDRRQQATPLTIDTIVQNLNSTVTAHLATIASLVQNVKKNVKGSANVSVGVETNLDDIQAAFQTAAASLLSSTKGSASGTGGIAQQFTAAQVSALNNDLQSVAAVVTQFQATVQAISANLSPAAMQTVSDEIAAVQAAIQPFVTPLQNLATAVAAANTAAVGGLKQSSSGLATVVTGIATRLSGILSGFLGLGGKN